MKLVKKKDNALSDLLNGLSTLTKSSDTIRLLSHLGDYELDIFEQNLAKAAKMVPSIRRFVEQQKKANKEA